MVLQQGSILFAFTCICFYSLVNSIGVRVILEGSPENVAFIQSAAGNITKQNWILEKAARMITWPGHFDSIVSNDSITYFPNLTFSLTCILILGAVSQTILLKELIQYFFRPIHVEYLSRGCCSKRWIHTPRMWLNWILWSVDIQLAKSNWIFPFQQAKAFDSHSNECWHWSAVKLPKFFEPSNPENCSADSILPINFTEMFLSRTWMESLCISGGNARRTVLAMLGPPILPIPPTD